MTRLRLFVLLLVGGYPVPLFSQPFPARTVAELEELIRSEDNQQLIERFEKYLQAHPEVAEASYQLGYIYYRKSSMKDAVKSLSSCLSRDPNHPDAHRILGFALTALRRNDLAEKEFRQALQLKPDSAESHYALGKLLYGRGAYEPAVASFRRAVEHRPSYVNAHESLGLAYEALNDIEAARRHLLKAIELSEGLPEPSEWPNVSIAGFHNRRANYHEALQYAKRAIAIDSGSDVAHFQCAKAYCGLRQWLDCARELRIAIEINGRVPEFFYLLSVAQRRLGQAEQADSSLDQFERLKTWEATSGASTIP